MLSLGSIGDFHLKIPSSVFIVPFILFVEKGFFFS